MKQWLTSLIILLTILIFSGCATHEGPTYGEQVVYENNDQVFRLDTVAILDKSLQKWEYHDLSGGHSTKSKLAVENLGIKSLETGNVEVFTTIRNRTDYALQLMIRSQFYDDNKITTEEPTSWKRVYFPPNSVMTYKEKSITMNKINHFLIEIKEGD